MSSSHHSVPYELFVGIDIAAATASAAWQTSEKKPGKAITIEQTPEGFATLQRTLLLTHVAPGQVLVVMEATGTYWLSLATFLVRQGFVVSAINPAQAHYFAKAFSGEPRRMPLMPRHWHNWRPCCNRNPGLLLLQSMRSWNSA